VPSTGRLWWSGGAFSDWRHGWLLTSRDFTVTSHTLYATGDGGNSWQHLPDPPVGSTGLTFRGSSEGWIGNIGLGQHYVYTSKDGGSSWQRRDLPVPPRWGLPSDTLVAATVRLLPEAGVLRYLSVPGAPTHGFTSFDEGSSWNYVPPRPIQILVASETFAESFADALHWWAIDGGILYKSSDAGQTWTPFTELFANAESWHYEAHVIDSKHAWAGGFNGDVTAWR
jgi:photosystem II stability/assembly factor-like uncharacterized protein